MTTRKPGSSFRIAALACGVILASGCASTPRNPDDPLEGYNRAMFAFNENLDKALVKPVAQAYDYVTPKPVQTGVGNFFGNLADPWIGLNNMLQGKPAEAFSDWMRFMVNSVFGIFGLLDIASEARLPKHDEDFGQTLAVWGVGEGPYFVVPFFGPRTVRDAAVLPVDLVGDKVWRAGHVPTRNAIRVLDITHARATLLGADRTLEESTFDKYAYLRDFYLQQRRYKVHDGNPPVEYEDFNGASLPGQSPRLVDMAAVAAIARLELVDPMAVGAVETAPVPNHE
ncbi:VacJ family lipoprotein [Thauera sp. CAU 1555]|uniref:VacJ family lipoprotein n=1 Tax=Thauera sedimentorum TaxID=2767595 RepID=A0ABR9BDR7_9RHOO|nr:VacJ family lipoprotein [Thauera sedimentorum]MBC9073564.1 VacJ family lipoprotein [Thauera sedimentorum]MBD8504483.1 VacJ family lipoprotein [Thauera sedimentorum]